MSNFEIRHNMFIQSILLFPLLLLSQIMLYKSFSAADSLFWYCPDYGSVPKGSIYLSNRDELLHTLPSKAELNNGYYNDSIGASPNQAYGLIMCYADASPDDCNNCLVNVTTDNRCNSSYDASKFYESCFVRFANYSFFSRWQESWEPACRQSTPGVSVPNFLNSSSLQLLITSLTTEASNSAYRYSTGYARYATNQTLQVLLQCTRDLLPEDCRQCISYYISYASQNGDNCSDWQGAKIMGPNCYVRYELYSFDVVKPPSPTPASAPLPAPRASRKGITSKLVIIVAVSITAFFLLFATSALCFCRRRRPKKHQKSIHDSKVVNLHLDNNDNFLEILDKNDSATVVHLNESMDSSLKVLAGPSAEFKVFELSTLKGATDNFSSTNQLGRGGFGPVYKGTLSDGREIAVKRLSGSSVQGLRELKNEVDLLGKLKHRNLVQLFGCCIQEEEKLLCYEYLPNGSLDKIIFENDLVKRAELDWTVRHKIIEGISRGLLYLHEESRMRIIHRDLKASNILLDRDMSPKISDFGLAKFFDDDQTHKDTSIIAGTFGYMAPEYVFHGNISAKSDVYSFGVLMLEIVMGRKNSSFSSSELSSSIISHALKHWRMGSVYQLKDPVLTYDSIDAIIRCVHLALLCVQDNPTDRPNLEAINLMLSDDSVAIPAICSTWFLNRIDASTSEEDLTTKTSSSMSRHAI